MAAYLVAFACLLAATLTSAQQVVPGKCNATAMPNFDMTKYTGVWYVVSSIPSIFEQGDTCGRATNTLLAKNLLQLNETATKGSKIVVALSNVSAPNMTEPGKLVQNSSMGIQAPYWILDTDYMNYSVVYSCQEIATFRIELAWVVSRATSINDDIAKKVEAIFAKNTIDMKGLKPEVQKNCVNY